MIKIFNSEQIKAWDLATIREQSISSCALMERAALAFSGLFKKYFQPVKSIAIICGLGNNGGDGLAVGRILKQSGYTVRCYVIGDEKKGTSDFKFNLARAAECQIVTFVTDIAEINFNIDEIIIDGLFGTGLSRAVSGIEAQVINLVNQNKNPVISIDIPSGLYTNRTADGPVIKANHTFTFQSPKLSFFFPENTSFVGRWQVLDIGLDEKFYLQTPAAIHLLETVDIQNLFIPRKKFTHKGDYGHLLLIAGSHGKMGACVLAARSALRSGCGLVTVNVPACGYQIVQTDLPEAMVITDSNEKRISHLTDLKPFSCIAVGPGLGTDASTVPVIEELLKKSKCPLVIDADALNIIAEHPSLVSLIPKFSVLTPHPGEFRRLSGSWKNDSEKFDLLRQMAQTLAAVIVLKGANTMIAMPDGSVYISQTGNPYMATGGSGDVLTGVIAAFICQGFKPEEAAKMGVWLHGLAGDLASQGCYPILAGDIIQQLAAGWKQLFGLKSAESGI